MDRGHERRWGAVEPPRGRTGIWRIPAPEVRIGLVGVTGSQDLKGRRSLAAKAADRHQRIRSSNGIRVEDAADVSGVPSVAEWRLVVVDLRRGFEKQIECREYHVMRVVRDEVEILNEHRDLAAVELVGHDDQVVRKCDRHSGHFRQRY